MNFIYLIFISVIFAIAFVESTTSLIVHFSSGFINYFTRFNTFSSTSHPPSQLKLFRQPEEISIFYRLSDKFLTFYFIFSSSSNSPREAQTWQLSNLLSETTRKLKTQKLKPSFSNIIQRTCY